jgi:hypothetical protein
VSPGDPFSPPYFGTGGTGGTWDDDAGGVGESEHGGSGGAPVSGSGGAPMSSSGSGGASSSSGGAAGSGASQHGHHRPFHAPLLGCSAGGELGAQGWSWLWIGAASVLLRRRARKQR